MSVALPSTTETDHEVLGSIEFKGIGQHSGDKMSLLNHTQVGI